MGTKIKVHKDYISRNFFLKNEMNIKLMKYYTKVLLLDVSKGYVYYKFLKKFHLNSSSSRLVNRCLYTGRANWIIRRFKTSRMTFKELADYGILCGVRRATW